MLKRVPVNPDGTPVDRFGDSPGLYKPFKTPSFVAQREQPQRAKRKRVSYKGAQAEGVDDSDDENGKKRKKKGKDGHEQPDADNRKTWPTFKERPFEEISRRFIIPAIRNAEGEYVRPVATNPALGVRPLTVIPPRPLHDPMEDHAIVLFDPTIDDRETDEERREREKEEQKEREAKEAEEKNAGRHNPHGKTLKQLLGDPFAKKKVVNKVPVVIDPKLGRVLRPHQVEGVKVR